MGFLEVRHNSAVELTARRERSLARSEKEEDMSFWNRLLGRENKVPSDVSVCDFCEWVATGDTKKVALIKELEVVTELGATIGCGFVKDASRYDPNDGKLFWFACHRCVT